METGPIEGVSDAPRAREGWRLPPAVVSLLRMTSWSPVAVVGQAPLWSVHRAWAVHPVDRSGGRAVGVRVAARGAESRAGRAPGRAAGSCGIPCVRAGGRSHAARVRGLVKVLVLLLLTVVHVGAVRGARAVVEERGCGSTGADSSNSAVHAMLLVDGLGRGGERVAVAVGVLDGEAVGVDAGGVELVQLHLLALLALDSETGLLLALPALLQEVPEEEARDDGDEGGGANVDTGPCTVSQAGPALTEAWRNGQCLGDGLVGRRFTPDKEGQFMHADVGSGWGASTHSTILILW